MVLIPMKIHLYLVQLWSCTEKQRVFLFDDQKIKFKLSKATMINFKFFNCNRI